MIRHHVSLVLLIAASFFGCGARQSVDEPDRGAPGSAEPTAAETTVPVVDTPVTAAGAPSSLADTFDVHLPRGRHWLIVNDGAFNAVENTFLLAAMNPERQTYLSVSVAPLPPKVQTLDAMKPLWEMSFLKNAAKKSSSENIRIGRRDAYRVIAAMDGPEGTQVELLGILMVANGRSYTLGVTTRGTGVDDPEVKAFIESFRILDGPD